MEETGGENIWLTQEEVLTLQIEESFGKYWGINVALTCTPPTIGAGCLACHATIKNSKFLRYLHNTQLKHI